MTASRKPEWLRITQKRQDEYRELKLSLTSKGLHTVCEEASCPNLNECWAAKTATVMILGDTCTRGCRFCHIKTGNPQGRVDFKEIQNISALIGELGLHYVVITSVDRDDLPDKGSGYFSQVITHIKEDHPHIHVEALVPDFDANEKWMQNLAMANPYVIGQNIETVERLTTQVRDPRAGYKKTLDCLKYYKNLGLKTKTSLMVGLGETRQELDQTIEELSLLKVDILTIGQYLQPTTKHLPVSRYYTPDEFNELKIAAYKKGFSFVASGPFVRSSYKAAQAFSMLNQTGENNI